MLHRLMAVVAVLMLGALYSPSCRIIFCWKLFRLIGIGSHKVAAYDLFILALVAIAASFAWLAFAHWRQERKTVATRTLGLTTVCSAISAFLLGGMAVSIVAKFEPFTIDMHRLGFGTSNRNACINNLRQIDGAKQQWALEQGKKETDTPTPEDISPYVKGGWRKCVCPRGGTYSINPLGQLPTCSAATSRWPRERVSLLLWESKGGKGRHAL